jgi:DNA-binding NtrC family response regulator
MERIRLAELVPHAHRPGRTAGTRARPVPPRLLLADASDASRSRLCSLLEDDPGLPVDGAADGRAALKALGAQCYSLVLTDLRMPHLGGLQLLEAVHRRRLPVPVIVLAAGGGVAEVKQALRLGAYDFLTKPVDIERLRRVVSRALSERAPPADLLALRKGGDGAGPFHGLLSNNEHLRAVFDLVARVARTTTTVLIEGETGTGKEQVAGSIHAASAGRPGPLVAVNCAAVPGPLLESEFFGHEKGAFTSAAARRLGRFELADGGTLFLDEVDALPPGMQAKLLRVLQERCFERLGGDENVRVDVRVVAASSRPLLGLVKEGAFREDLYYRLNIVRIDLPPLRERPEDIPGLARHFAARSAKEVSPEALEGLLAHHWPGNIRELENAIERAAVICRGPTIRPDDLPAEVLRPVPHRQPVPIDLSRPLTDLLEEARAAVEESYLRTALRKARGNITRCARLCGMSRRSVARKVIAFGIDKADFRGRE